MESKTTIGTICIKDEMGITYSVCNLEYTVYNDENETYEYRFYPNYKVIDLIPKGVFSGIPGINLDIRKEVYIRSNMTPCFISERVPSKNRENFYEELEEVGLTYLDPIIYLIRTKYMYSGDALFMKEKIERRTIDISELISNKTNNFNKIRSILCNIAIGNDVIINDVNISTKETFLTLYCLYEKSYKSMKYSIENSELPRKNKGRKEKVYDEGYFDEIHNLIKSKQISLKDGLKKLNMNKDKYYRIIKKNEAK